MMRRVAVLVTGLALVTAVLATPRPAAADDDNLQYIIPAAVAGVVAVIVIIAIVMADRSEPEFEFAALPASEPLPGGLRLAPDCAPAAGALPLLCW